MRELSSKGKHAYINGDAQSQTSTNGNGAHINSDAQEQTPTNGDRTHINKSETWKPDSLERIKERDFEQSLLLTSTESLEFFRRPDFSFSCQRCSTILLRPTK